MAFNPKMLYRSIRFDLSLFYVYFISSSEWIGDLLDIILCRERFVLSRLNLFFEDMKRKL